jgi:N-acetylmuramoyl-L-alanine amidase
MMPLSHPSPNFDTRRLPVSMLVLHYTGMESAEAAIDHLANPAAKVSAHWVVTESGEVIAMVDEANRAWHAGKAYWRGITDVNSASIGIEIVNPGHEFGYRRFPPVQMDAVETLVAAAVRRFAIDPANVVGHSDVAPARKEDPGELFDWQRLAAADLAVPMLTGGNDPGWSDAATVAALHRYGYDVTDPKAAITAFQRRFRPARLDGVIDAETRSILCALSRFNP